MAELAGGILNMELQAEDGKAKPPRHTVTEDEARQGSGAADRRQAPGETAQRTLVSFLGLLNLSSVEVAELNTEFEGLVLQEVGGLADVVAPEGKILLKAGVESGGL